MFSAQRLTLLTLVFIGQAWAGDQTLHHETVKDLGRLNGVALHCNYLHQVRAMKAAVVANAPKQRSYGLAFDEATNEAFLTQIQESRPCPGEAGFANQVEAAVKRLQDVFSQP